MVSNHQEMDTSTDGVGVATSPESMEIDDPDSDSDDLDLVQVNSRDSLANKIIESLETSKFDARAQDFLPANCINNLITRKVIADELELHKNARKDQAWQRKFIDWIFRNARKVFATVIQSSDRGSSITMNIMIQFRRAKFDDRLLPIGNPRAPPGVMSQSRPFDPRWWDSPRLYNFYIRQWEFLAPVFSPDKYSYNLPSECILPFIWKDPKPKEGAFSAVYRVKIHAAHQKHPDLKDASDHTSNHDCELLIRLTGCR